MLWRFSLMNKPQILTPNLLPSAARAHLAGHETGSPLVLLVVCLDIPWYALTCHESDRERYADFQRVCASGICFLIHWCQRSHDTSSIRGMFVHYMVEMWLEHVLCKYSCIVVSLQIHTNSSNWDPRIIKHAACRCRHLYHHISSNISLRAVIQWLYSRCLLVFKLVGFCSVFMLCTQCEAA